MNMKEGQILNKLVFIWSKLGHYWWRMRPFFQLGKISLIARNYFTVGRTQNEATLHAHGNSKQKQCDKIARYNKNILGI